MAQQHDFQTRVVVKSGAAIYALMSTRPSSYRRPCCHRSLAPNQWCTSLAWSCRRPPLKKAVTTSGWTLADYLSAVAPAPLSVISWLAEPRFALAKYRVFLKHVRKPSSHDQQSSQHDVWPTCGPNCVAYIAHSFPGALGLFCRTRRLPPHMNSAKP